VCYSQDSGRPNILVLCCAAIGAHHGTAAKAVSRKAVTGRCTAIAAAAADPSARPQ